MAKDLRKLARFEVTKTGEDAFTLHIEDEAGELLELSATADQLDVVADALDDILEASEEEDEDA